MKKATYSLIFAASGLLVLACGPVDDVTMEELPLAGQALGTCTGDGAGQANQSTEGKKQNQQGNQSQKGNQSQQGDQNQLKDGSCGGTNVCECEVGYAACACGEKLMTQLRLKKQLKTQSQAQSRQMSGDCLGDGNCTQPQDGTGNSQQGKTGVKLQDQLKTKTQSRIRLREHAGDCCCCLIVEATPVI
jgi:hypothetical protein